MLPLRKNLSGAKHLPYPAIKWFVPLIVVLVHFLITFEEDPPIAYILSNWGYYRALLFSTGVAVLLVWWVRRQSIRLDAKVSWTADFGGRLKLQLLLAVLVPLLFALVLATTYFACLHINILHTVYFRRYLPLMVLLLLLLNLLVLVWHLYFKRKPYIYNTKVVQQVQVAGHIATNEVAVLYVLDGVCYYHNTKGGRFGWTETFQKAVEQLGSAFFLIRRGVLVNRSAIVNVLPDGKLLKVELAFEVPVPLVVSHRKLSGFKQWLAQE